MLSPQQQRGRLRAIVVRTLRNFNSKERFKSAIKSNGQSVSGNLLRSIGRSSINNRVSVSSSIDSTTGILDNVTVTVEIPWGTYGAKLDTEFGSSFNASEPMIPPLSSISSWIQRKGIQGTSYVSKTLKSGESKTYSYSGVTGRKIMAYRIQQNIIEENELRTRYDYADNIREDLQDAIDEAVNEWAAEMAEEQYIDVLVELEELY
jgi:hypothetical protein